MPHALAYYTLRTSISVLSRGLAGAPAPVPLPAQGAYDVSALPTSGAGGAWSPLAAASHAVADATDSSSLKSLLYAQVDGTAAALEDAAFTSGAAGVDTLTPAPMRLSSGERLVLSADSWLIKEGVPRDVIAQRARALTSGVSALPFDAASASWPALTGDGISSTAWPQSLSLSTIAASRAAALQSSSSSLASRSIPPVGIALLTQSVSWRLTGTPLWAAHGLNASTYASYASGTSGSNSLTHVLELTVANSSLLSLEAGTLRPGYVYRAAVTSYELDAAWVTDHGLLLLLAGQAAGVTSSAVAAALGLTSADGDVASAVTSYALGALHPTRFRVSGPYWAPSGPASFVTRLPLSGGSLAAAPVVASSATGGLSAYTLATSGWRSDVSVYASAGSLAGTASALAVITGPVLPLSLQQQSLAAWASASSSLPWPSATLVALTSASLGLQGQLSPADLLAASRAACASSGAGLSGSQLTLPPAWWSRLALVTSALTYDGLTALPPSALTSATAAMCAALTSAVEAALPTARSRVHSGNRELC